MFKRLANVLEDTCRLSSMMEATVLVLILVTEVLGLPHSDASWTDFQLSLNSISHFLMLELLRHSSPKAFFSNPIVSLDVFSSRMLNSMQTAARFFNSSFWQLQQHSVPHTPFLYQQVKTCYSLYNVHIGVEWCKKHSSFREYRHFTHIIHSCFSIPMKIPTVGWQGSAATPTIGAIYQMLFLSYIYLKVQIPIRNTLYISGAIFRKIWSNLW